MSQRLGYFVAGVVIRQRRRRRVEVLVMDTVGHLGVQTTKFPGGLAEPEDGGDPEKTLKRELEEESGLRVRSDAKTYLLLKTHDNRDRYFYLVRKRDCLGTLRIKIIKDGPTTLFRPHWVDFENFEADLFARHQTALTNLGKLFPEPRER
jgi:8-oxo-dGTP pyrophosphatase MutT (NUDIX family)